MSDLLARKTPSDRKRRGNKFEMTVSDTCTSTYKSVTPRAPQ
jgi:hypothetical protein